MSLYFMLLILAGIAVGVWTIQRHIPARRGPTQTEMLLWQHAKQMSALGPRIGAVAWDFGNASWRFSRAIGQHRPVKLPVHIAQVLELVAGEVERRRS